MKMKPTKLTAGGLTLLVATLAFCPTARAETTIYRGSGLSASGGCWDYDPATDTYTYFSAGWGTEKQRVSRQGSTSYSYGYVYFAQYNNSTNEYCYGSFDVGAKPDISKSLTSATASAFVTLYCYTYDPITGEYIDLGTDDITLDVALQGTGSTKSNYKYSYSYKDPSHYNASYSGSGQQRTADATFAINGQTYTPSANGGCYGYLSNGKWSSKVTVNP